MVLVYLKLNKTIISINRIFFIYKIILRWTKEEVIINIIFFSNKIINMHLGWFVEKSCGEIWRMLI